MLIDYTGTNKLFQDYGPTEGVVDNPENFDWFDRNLADPTVRSLARVEYRDMLFDRGDALNLFNEVAQDGTVSANEFSDLQKLAGTILQKPADVNYLFTQVVDGNTANAHYQGGALGNLKSGSSATQLNKLVDKWFEGTDLPAIGNTGTTAVAYQQVSGSLFVNGVNYYDVDQGSVDDCYFMAVLGEAATDSPQSLTNMFIVNGDGTYSVRFYNGSSEAFVTVNGELPVVTNSGTAFFAGWGFTEPSTTVVKNMFNNSGNELWSRWPKRPMLRSTNRAGSDKTTRTLTPASASARHRRPGARSPENRRAKRRSTAPRPRSRRLSPESSIPARRYAAVERHAARPRLRFESLLHGLGLQRQQPTFRNHQSAQFAPTSIPAEAVTEWVGWNTIGKDFADYAVGNV